MTELASKQTKGQARSSVLPDAAVLERFVVENDDLLELEERIGRFNIFDALRIARVEIRHSNFLAWLLDPAESHGQGSLFLNAVLMDLLRQAPVEQRPLSPVELDGEELRGVEIRREWRYIDLLISCKEPAFVVAVENKVGSGEHGDQLARYQKTVAENFPGRNPMFVYLTTDGDEASEDGWVPYAYADVHRVLGRVRSMHGAMIGDDVLAFIDHYLRLIGSRFMDDPKLDELCQRIYKNHRQALDLIFERVGSPAAGLLAELASLIESHKGEWEVVNKTSKRVEFVPRQWLEWFPAVGKRPKFDKRFWVTLRFEVRKKRLNFATVVCPTDEPAIREQIVNRLVQDPREFGCRLLLKNAGLRWTRLGTTPVAAWREEDGPDEEKVIAAAKKKLDQLQQQLSGVPDALQPIVATWRNERG